SPARAAYAAIAEPALPDESSTTSRAPSARSAAMSTAAPRSLKDPVGLVLSTLNRSRPSREGSRGVPPSPSETSPPATGITVRYRQTPRAAGGKVGGMGAAVGSSAHGPPQTAQRQAAAAAVAPQR